MEQSLHVLVADGDHEQRCVFADSIAAMGGDVALCEGGRSALDEFSSRRPDILITNLDLSDVSGWDVVERVRSVSTTPIIVCSGEPTVESLKKGFDLSVDGFLVCPVSGDDVRRRIEMIVKRSKGNGEDPLYSRNGLTIDWRSCQVTVDGQWVELTRTEFRLLKYLVEHQGWVLSHDQILTDVWGPEYKGERDRVKLYVCYLRRKIERDPCNPELIMTRRGLGYSFVG